MNTRAIRFWSLLLLAGSPATAAVAQTAPASSPSLSDVLKAVNTVSTKVEQLSGELRHVKSELAAVQEKMATGPPLPQRTAAPGSTELTASSESNQYVTKSEFDRVKGELKDLVKVAKDRSDLLETVVAQISTSGGAGHSIPDVHAIMEDPAGREALNEAVHEVMRREGTLVVENRMDQGYQLLLNNRTYNYIGPHETKSIPVRLGTITTELVGFEAAKNWSVGPPDYQQSIVVGPKPTQAVVTGSPVNYYWDPLWGWLAVQ